MDGELVDVVRVKNRIAALLKRIRARHCLLSVTVGDNEQCFTSVLLEVVNETSSYIVIDEL